MNSQQTTADLKTNGQMTVLNAFLDKMEGTLKTVTEKVKSVADGAALQTDYGLAEAENAWTETLNWLAEKKNAALDLPSKAREAADTAVVRMHLGRMEANDALENTKKRMERMQGEIQSLQTHVSADAKEILKRLQTSFKNISGNLLH